MRLLLDTHAFLWFVLDDAQLSDAARAAIEDGQSEVLVSPASYWEIAIKISIGKYELTAPYEAFWSCGIDENSFQILPISVRHAAALVDLPFHHRDPFDRMLIAQAVVEDLTLVSAEKQFDSYPIRRVW